MPSALIDPLFERLFQSYPADHAYDADDWTDGPMPDSLRQFLEQVLKHRGRLEVHRLRQVRTEWVAYENPAVETAARELEDAVQIHVRIPADEWEEVLHQAARVMTRYLVHPVATLTVFIFDDGDTALPLNQIQWRMQFFGPYEYLHEAVETYAERRSLSRIHPDTFRSFLARIDARAVSENNAEQHLRLLDPLFTIARVATGTKAVPTRLLRRFFEEKRASRLARRLEEHEQSGHPEMSPSALRRLIEETDEISEEAGPAIAPPLDISISEPLSSPSASDLAHSSSPSAPSEEEGPSPIEVDEPGNVQHKNPAPEEGQPDEEMPEPTAENVSGAEAERETGDASEADEEDAKDVAPEEAEMPESTDREPLTDFSAQTDPKPAGDEKPAHDTTASRAEALSEEHKEESLAETNSNDNEEATPRWQQFQTVRPSRAESSASESGEQTPLWARFQPFHPPSSDDGSDESSEDPSSPHSGSVGEQTQTLERHIFGTSPAPHRDAYVRHLFKGSVEDYRQILSRIRRANSWNEASQIIAKDVFRANQVNIYSDVAVDFTDAVEAHFRE